MADQNRSLTRETANEGFQLTGFAVGSENVGRVGLRPASPGARDPSRRLLAANQGTGDDRRGAGNHRCDPASGEFHPGVTFIGQCSLGVRSPLAGLFGGAMPQEDDQVARIRFDLIERSIWLIAIRYHFRLP
jgi:hypothetical protein